MVFLCMHMGCFPMNELLLVFSEGGQERSVLEASLCSILSVEKTENEPPSLVTAVTESESCSCSLWVEICVSGHHSQHLSG